MEFPRPNHAVSENGIYILRKTRAKRTEKVTVPMSWYFPRRYDGSLLFIGSTRLSAQSFRTVRGLGLADAKVEILPQFAKNAYICSRALYRSDTRQTKIQIK